MARRNPPLMMNLPDESTIGLMLSGGLDSCILLSHLLSQGRPVQPFYVRSQLVWQAAELPAVERYLAAVSQPGLLPLVIFDLPLADVYGVHWSTTGQATPDAASPDEAVYLPGRNPLLLIKAAVWCSLHDISHLALGTLSANPFVDASDAFFQEYQSALNRALACRTQFVRPFAQFSKQQVMQLGRELPLERTFSCIAPVGPLHCGGCNKCAERRRAFALAEMTDHTQYAASTASNCQPPPSAAPRAAGANGRAAGHPHISKISSD